jgi:hypothetical protein
MLLRVVVIRTIPAPQHVRGGLIRESRKRKPPRFCAAASRHASVASIS